MKRKTRKTLEEELIVLTSKYERKAFDFEQIVQVCLSLNSGLELSQLIQSILFLCMGHFGVAKAGMFIRTDLNQSDLVLHRSQFGFSLDFGGSKSIPQDHELLVFLDRHYQCFSYREINDQRPGIMEATPLQVMQPDLLMIDIDNFKALNDSLGHVAGDGVIIMAARIIMESIRLSDLAARYGGEEFSVLINNPDKNTARKIAERIRRKIQAHHGTFQGQPWSITVSIGLGTFDPNLDPSMEAFIHRTDTYLYTSKRLGKNRITSI